MAPYASLVARTLATVAPIAAPAVKAVLAEDLLKDVFDGEDAGHHAVLVGDDRQRGVAQAHVQQDGRQPAGGSDHQRRLPAIGHRDRFPRFGWLAETLLDVDHAGDFVAVGLVDRKAREARLLGQRRQVGQGGVFADVEDVAARHQDVQRGELAEA